MAGNIPGRLCRLDLRFVPDAQSFAGRAQRDTATEAPQGYEPPPAFATAALQHSRVKLTWDATPDERRRAMSRRVRAEELRDDDFKVGMESSLCIRRRQCMEMRLHARSGRGLREGLRHCGNSSDLGRHPWQAPMHPLRHTETPGDGLKA